jgi:predicted nucleotidyltransferase
LTTHPSAPSAGVILMDDDIERAAHTLAETAGSPLRVILFGSHARGEARAGSDLDFLVIEPEVSDRHAEMVRLRSALHGMRRPIDVLVYSEAQVDEWGRGTRLRTSRRTFRGPGACRSAMNEM